MNEVRIGIGVGSVAGNPARYAYDRFGNLAAVTNALGNAIVYEYDLRGRKTYEGGATYPVRYTYDVFGNKVAMTTYRAEGAQEGDVTQWLYDEASNCMTNKVYADGNGTKYEYDAHGRLAKRTWARGIDTTYTYNAWGSLTRTDYSDSTPSVVLTYDAMGRQTRAVDAAGITTFAYDSFGSLTNETVVGVAGTNTIERFYDAFGRDAGYALNGARQSTLAYDPATGRLATMLVPEAQSNNQTNQTIQQFSWSYLPGSDLKSSLAYPNGLTASWTYGNRGELLEVNNASPTGTISRYAYTYDAAGRRVACAKSGSAFDSPDTNSYLYNSRSELTNATAAVDSAYRYGYDFDDIGNRRSSLECGVQSAEYEANSLNQYKAVDDFTPQYDDDGNQTLVKTATGIWQVTYNGENRPVRWTQGDTVITMSFDRMGRRVTKNDRRCVYDGYLQIADNSGNAYVWDPTEPVATHPLAWQRSALGTQHSTLFYTHDGNKNVSEAIASNNDVSAHYEYAPFGALTISRGESAAANPWRFSSEFAEDDTATVYYNYRHYDPVMGRWLERDPVWELGGENLFAYCSNGPWASYDRLGLYSSYGITTHQNLVEKALDEVLEEGEAQCVKKRRLQIKELLSENNAKMDSKPYSDDKYLYLHYNQGTQGDFSSATNQYVEALNQLADDISQAIKDGGDAGCSEAMEKIGNLTHMLQDYYGHGVAYDYEVGDHDEKIGNAVGDPYNPLMKPSNYNGFWSKSQHGRIYQSEPGIRAPDGPEYPHIAWSWDYNVGRLGLAKNTTKDALRKYLNDWCGKCCNTKLPPSEAQKARDRSRRRRHQGKH